MNYLNGRLKDLKKEDFAVGPMDTSDIDEPLYPKCVINSEESSLERLSIPENNRPNQKSDRIRTEDDNHRPSNVYVLNVAFFSFLGFMMVQAVFAIIANSESMLADSEAMSVDALTYLFNMFAESIKNRPLSPYELSLPSHICKRRRTMKRLYLELIPPLISVTTLIVVTVYVMRDSLQTFFSQHGEFDPPEEDVDITIMLLFSGFNLLLDIVNVTCFARAQQAFGLQSMHLQSSNTRKDKIGEGETVQSKNDVPTESTSLLDNRAEELEKESMFGANLNMCSAWTHVCADTMRSLAVLVASAIATIFPSIEGDIADSSAAIIVSLIIISSLFPLIYGLFLTAREIVILSRTPLE